MISILSRRIIAPRMRNLASLMQVKCASSMGDPIEHATGIEKRELLAKLAGNDNPFCMVVLKRGPGTRCDPNEIPSAYEKRLVGCICEEEAASVTYMWLVKDQPRRCECGHWFKLVPVSPF